MVTKLFMGKVFDEFYDKCKGFLKEKIFDRRKLEELSKGIAEHHKQFSEINCFAQNSRFQQFVENNLKLYEQYNAICKIEPSYRTINDIQSEIILKCINEFHYIRKSDIKSYYKKIFELINTTLYAIAQETDIGRFTTTMNEIGQRLDGTTKEILAAIEQKQFNTADLIRSSSLSTTEINVAPLFEKSQKHYDEETSYGGRFAYVNNDFDDAIIPTVKLFETKGIEVSDLVQNVNKEQKNLVEYAIYTDNNILFIGEGGMGKTMALFHIWQRQLDLYPENQKLPIYIPLNEYNVYKSREFIREFVYEKYNINLDNDIGLIKTILLLDGFNEINTDNKSNIVNNIRVYLRRENIQIILTSRYDFRVLHDFNIPAYVLQPLDDKTIKDFLSKSPINMVIKKPHTILRNPMMLTLFAKVSIIRNEIEKKFKFKFKFATENLTIAKILHNYMLCQIGKVAIDIANGYDNIDVVKSAFALQRIVPYIAYKIEYERQFTMTTEWLRTVIREFLVDSDYSKNEYEAIKDEISEISVMLVRHSNYSEDVHEYFDLLTDRHYVFLGEDENHIFRHQHFRDFFSAMYIAKALKDWCDSHSDIMPVVLTVRILTPHIVKMLAEYLEKDENIELIKKKTVLHKIIEAIRDKKSIQFGFALRNIINLWREIRQGQIIGEDLSRLDFSHVPLNGIRFYDENTVTSFDGALLSSSSLLSLNHNSQITSATYSPKGKFILTASYDSTARVWDSETGDLIKTLTGHSDRIASATYSPNGDFILTGSWDSTARVWDNKTNECVELKAHSDRVNASYSPDGNFILTASLDGTAWIWDSASYERIRPLKTHGERINHAMYCPKTGDFIVTASDDNTARIYSSTGEFIEALEGHNGRITKATYSPDGKFIVTASDDNTARIYSSTGEFIRVLEGHRGRVNSATYSMDGLHIITTSSDKTARIYSSTGEFKKALEGHNSDVNHAVYSPSSERRFILTASCEAVRIWDSATYELIRIIEGHSGGVANASYSPNGKFALTGTWDGMVQIWGSLTGNLIKTLYGHDSWVNSVTYSPDGNYILTASYDKTARIWNSKTGELIKELEGHNDRVNSATYSQDGKFIVTASSDKTARIWDSQGNYVRTINEHLNEHSDSLIHAAYSPDNKYIVTASWDKTARIWDSETATRVFNILEGHSKWLTDVAYSPDGKFILTASSDNTVRMHNSTGNYIRTLEGHNNWVNSIAYSAHGELIFTASGDGTLRIWDRDGNYIRTLEGHNSWITSIAYNPEIERIITADIDGKIIQWCAVTNDIISTIKYYSGLHIQGCSFKNSIFDSTMLEGIIKQYGGFYIIVPE